MHIWYIIRDLWGSQIITKSAIRAARWEKGTEMYKIYQMILNILDNYLTMMLNTILREPTYFDMQAKDKNKTDCVFLSAPFDFIWFHA